jgi:NadR type nicotinamide-nucleotide adenylyltransferase
LKRIVIIGPESTGKSTLTQQLASHFNAIGIDEYARQYLSEITRPYVQGDLLEIGKGQVRLEDAAAQTSGDALLFCDTDLYVLKVWSESKYGTCDEWILREIATRRYDFYILTDIDMPWQDDVLREHPEPEMRRHFFEIYKDIVVHSGAPFVIAKGNEQERLEIAIGGIMNLNKNH